MHQQFLRAKDINAVSLQLFPDRAFNAVLFLANGPEGVDHDIMEKLAMESHAIGHHGVLVVIPQSIPQTEVLVVTPDSNHQMMQENSVEGFIEGSISSVPMAQPETPEKLQKYAPGWIVTPTRPKVTSPGVV
jgi:hypothetical protein